MSDRDPKMKTAVALMTTAMSHSHYGDGARSSGAPACVAFSAAPSRTLPCHSVNFRVLTVSSALYSYCYPIRNANNRLAYSTDMTC
jgi:hypothetical protein